MTGAEAGPKERVLRCLLCEPVRQWYGYELVQGVGVPSGTLYPQLKRLEEDRLVVSEWGFKGGRPRRYYEVPERAREAAGLELAALEAARLAVDARKALR